MEAGLFSDSYVIWGENVLEALEGSRKICGGLIGFGKAPKNSAEHY